MSRKNSPKTTIYPCINICLLGMNGAGKSAILVKFLTKRFITEYSPFINDKYSRSAVYNGQDFTLDIQDTYDREDLDLKEFSRWADVFIVIYSITSRSTFHRAEEILETLSSFNSGKEYSIVLVGNKTDLEQFRFVTKKEGESLADKSKALFIESSVVGEHSQVSHIFSLGILHYLSQSLNCPPKPLSKSKSSSPVRPPSTPITTINNIPMSPLAESVTTNQNSNGTTTLTVNHRNSPAPSSPALPINNANNSNTSIMKKLSSASNPSSSVSGSPGTFSNLGRNRNGAKLSVVSDLTNNRNSGTDFDISTPNSNPSPSSLGSTNSIQSVTPSPAKKNSVGFRFFKKSKF